MYRIGFDVGGTFTDFTLHDTASGALHHFKLPTTPADPSAAIAQGVAALIAAHGIAPADISFVGHGTTIATNMVIERRGVPTGLITTRGFRDVLEIGRQVRPHLYDYTVRTPVPLIPRERRIEVPERLDADGAVLVPLDEAAVLAAARTLQAMGVQAVAICFLHAYLNDVHEARAADLVRSVLPDAYVCSSSGVLPEFREFERFSTTAINAAIGPRMERYLRGLLNRLAEQGIAAPPYTVHSNGGLMPVETVRAFPVRTCLSGPAAGVVGAAEVARAAGHPDVITFDAGGTSTDVSLIAGGMPAFATSRLVADYPVRTPMVDVHVIGAGGGSIAWLDDAGGLKVGPHSAGADPGPVAYGRGGREPTLTDANIVLHRLDPTALLGGRMAVDEAAARDAIAARIAAPLGLTVEQAALGVIRIAVANMSRAIRAVSTERGHDVGAFAVFPYGGAGPLHAAAVASECGISRALVPVEPGTLCARGILLSDMSLDLVRSAIIEAGAPTWPRVLAAFAAMAEQGAQWLDSEAVPAERRRFECVIDARYKGQNHEVQVPLIFAAEAGGIVRAGADSTDNTVSFPVRYEDTTADTGRGVKAGTDVAERTDASQQRQGDVTDTVCQLVTARTDPTLDSGSSKKRPADPYAGDPTGAATLEAFLAGFAAAHRREYGYSADRAVEIVNCRLKAIGLIDRPSARFTGGSGAPVARATRRVHFDGGWLDTPVYDRAGLAIGARLAGPAIFEEMSATTLLPPGWTLCVDTAGNLILETA